MTTSSKLYLWLIKISVIFFQLAQVHSKFNYKNLERQTISSYCHSFKTCNDCKKAAFQCEWCHDLGCTNHARLYCPKKVFLDNVLKRDVDYRYCTEIATKGPIFVPANERRYLRLDMQVDDMTIYERDIICEVHLENRVMQVAASIDKNSVFCDTLNFRLEKGLAIGHIRLIWGGAEPYSNSILLIVYSCKHLGRNCRECQMLNPDFQCGWCEDSMRCSLMEQCPRQVGNWVNRNLTCRLSHQEFRSNVANVRRFVY